MRLDSKPKTLLVAVSFVTAVLVTISLMIVTFVAFILVIVGTVAVVMLDFSSVLLAGNGGDELCVTMLVVEFLSESSVRGDKTR